MLFFFIQLFIIFSFYTAAESNQSLSIESENESTKSEIIARNVKADYWTENKAFSYFDYSDVNYFLNRLVSVRNLIKVFRARDEFKDMNQSLCGKSICQNYFMEVANFGMGRARVNQLPVILLVAGLHGDEAIGISALMHFLDRMATIYKVSPDWFRILNSVRFVVVPFANISGFSRGSDEEKVLYRGRHKYFNVKEDFNWRNESQCLLTATSELLFHIQQRYLVTAALVFTAGKNEIVYPSHPVYPAHPAPEKAAFEFVAKELAKAAEPPRSKSRSVYHSHYSVTGLETREHPNRYLMWLYGASENPDEARVLCFAKNKNFQYRFKYPTANSNRTFALEISLERSDRPRLSLGNEKGILYNLSKDFGPVVRVFNIIKRFAQLVQPTARVDSVQNDSETNASQVALSIKGCEEVSEVKFLDQLDANPKYELSPRTEPGSDPVVMLHYDFAKHSRWVDIGVGLVCDRPVYQSSSDGSPVSLLVRQKNRTATIEQNKQYLKALQLTSLTVWHIDREQPKQIKSFVKFPDEVLMVENDVLTLSIGTFFPMLLEYDHDGGFVHLKYDQSQISRPAGDEEERDWVSEVGITNIRASLRRSTAFNQLAKDLFTYQSTMVLSTSREVGRDNFVKPLTAQEEALVRHDLEFSSMTQTQINEQFPITDFLEQRNDIRNRVDPSNHNKDFQASVNYSARACYDYFLDLIGSRGIVRVFRKSKQKGFKPSNVMAAIAEAFQKYRSFHLGGEIMLYNRNTMELESNALDDGLVDPDEFRAESPVAAFKLWNSGLFCSSLEQTITDNLNVPETLAARARESGYFQTRPVFYAISVQRSTRDPTKVVIKLLVDSTLVRGHYVLHNKSEDIRLDRAKTDRAIRVGGVHRPIRLAKYWAELEYAKVQFIGSMLKLFDEDGRRLVFDCFLENYTLHRTIQNQFKNFVSIVKQVLEPDMFEHFYNGVPLEDPLDADLDEVSEQESELTSEELDEDEFHQIHSRQSASNLIFSVMLILFVFILIIIGGFFVYVRFIKPPEEVRSVWVETQPAGVASGRDFVPQVI